MEDRPHLPAPSPEMAQFRRNVQIDEVTMNSSAFAASPGALNGLGAPPFTASQAAESGSPTRSPTRAHTRIMSTQPSFKRAINMTGIQQIPASTPKRPALLSTSRLLKTETGAPVGQDQGQGQGLPEANAGHGDRSFMGDDTVDVDVYEDPLTGDQARDPPLRPLGSPQLNSSGYQPVQQSAQEPLERRRVDDRRSAYMSPLYEASVESPSVDSQRERGRFIERAQSRPGSREPSGEPREHSREPSREPTRDLSQWQRRRSTSREPTRELTREHMREHAGIIPPLQHPNEPTRELSGPLPRLRQPSTPRRAPTTPQRRNHTPFHPATPGRVVIPSSPQRDHSMSLAENEIGTVDQLMIQLGVPLQVEPIDKYLPGQLELENLNPVQYVWAELVQAEIVLLCEEGVALEASLKKFISKLDVRATARQYMSDDRAQRIEIARRVKLFSEYLLVGFEQARVDRELQLHHRCFDRVTVINSEYRQRLAEFEQLGARRTEIYAEMDRLRSVQEQSTALDARLAQLNSGVLEDSRVMEKKELYLKDLVQRSTLVERGLLAKEKEKEEKEVVPANPASPEIKTEGTPQGTAAPAQNVGATRQQYCAQLEAIRLELGADVVDQTAMALIVTFQGLIITWQRGCRLQFEPISKHETTLSSHFLHYLLENSRSVNPLKLKEATKVWRRYLDLELAIGEFMSRGGCKWKPVRPGVLKLEKGDNVVLTITSTKVEVMPKFSQLGFMTVD